MSDQSDTESQHEVSTWAEEMADGADHSVQPMTTDPPADTTTFLQVPTPGHAEEAKTPTSVMTRMSDIIGPPTDQEKRMHEQTRIIHNKGESSTPEQNKPTMGKKGKGKKKNKQLPPYQEGEVALEDQDVRHPSAMPQPLHVPKRDQREQGLRQQIKRMFSNSKSNSDKPLPMVPDSGNPYDPNSIAYIPGAYIPSPVTPQYAGPSQCSVTIPTPVAYQQQVQSNVPRDTTDTSATGWPLPSPQVKRAHPVKPTNRMASAQTVDSMASYPSGPRMNQNTGIILSHGHFTSPTRSGTLAAHLQPQLAHPLSYHSMVASIVDPQSPSYLSLNNRSSVVPEPHATSAEQYTAADPLEDSYNRDSDDSVSSPELGPITELDTTETKIRPRLARSNSMPSVAFSPFALRDAAPRAPPKVSGPSASGVVAAAPVTTAAVLGLVHTRLNQIQAQVNAMEHRIAASQQTAQAEVVRRMEALEGQMNRVLALLGRPNGAVGGYAGRGARGGRGGSMQARLGAMPPHIPYGGGQQNGW